MSTSTTSTSPPSSSRLTVALPSPSSIFVTTATDGRSRSPARAPPVAAWTESLDCTPAKTRSGALALDDLGERPGDLDRVEPRLRLDADAAVGAHGEAAPHGVLRVLVPDRHDDHLAGACGLDEAERLLGRVRVPLVQREVEVVGIDIPLVFGELDFVAEDGDLLHADDDLQASTASRSITWRSRLNGSGTSGFSESISRASLCPSKMQSATSRGATQSPIR